MDGPFLSVRNVEKKYDNGVQALKGVSFDVQQGEFLVVIGLSGSGKSTLLRCLNLLTEPSSGQIFFQGQNILEFKSAEEVRVLRRKIAMVFQHFNLIPRYSVLQNVLLGQLGKKRTLGSIFGFFSQEERDQARKNLQLVGIEEKAFQRADQLSGGQQQRVAIARALTQNPSLLLADEPVSSLDPATMHIVMDYLKKINQELGLTVICNLHFISLVRQYATRVIALKDGELVFNGKPEEITSEWFQKIYGKGAYEDSQNRI